MVEKSKILSLIKTPVAIVGMGVSGDAALDLLIAAGVPRASLATYDKKSLADFQDENTLLHNFRPQTLVISPGVPLSLPWIQDFKHMGGLVTSELEVAFGVLACEKVIAISGSVGKSTTVSLLGAGVKSFSPPSFVGGNLGVPLAIYAKSVLMGNPRAEWVILELSSYQLENFKNLRADWSGLVSLTANHLERYQTLEQYYFTKASLIEKTLNFCFCNKSGADLWRWLPKNSNALKIKWTDKDAPSLSSLHLSASKLLGSHNQDNLALAVSIALAAQWPSSSIEAMKNFTGLPHRLENLGQKKGVLYVNDSKATTVESVKTAVLSLLPNLNGNLHLLLGGRDKSLPWHELADLSSIKNIRFYFFGECREVASRQSGLAGTLFPIMAAAVENAIQSAKSGDLILLSPGGTSLDEFKNFEARGDAFKNSVRNSI